MQADIADGSTSPDRAYETVIVGGGQAGLATGYFLSQRRANFAILDENARTGDSWRKRWDSLRLFTPSQLDALPGMAYPGDENYFPTKDELANYLEGYANRFNLPIAHGVKVQHLTHADGIFRLEAGATRVTARNVVVATGPYGLPRLPAFASDLDKNITQLHSSAYCNPGQLSGQRILVVGAGNSGAEIALELRAAGRQVWLAGRDVGILPISSPAAQLFGGRTMWWLMRRIMNVNTPMGRKAREQVLHHGHPLGRARREQLAQAGIELVGRVAGVEAGKPRLEDGRVVQADTVIWATGHRPDLGWIDLPIVGEDGWPKHTRGVVPDFPGLYFVGIPFQTAITSALLGGVGADAETIAGQIAKRDAVAQ